MQIAREGAPHTSMSKLEVPLMDLEVDLSIASASSARQPPSGVRDEELIELILPPSDR